MEPEILPPDHNIASLRDANAASDAPEPVIPPAAPPVPPPVFDFSSFFLDAEGLLRGGWSVLLFAFLTIPFSTIFSSLAYSLYTTHHPASSGALDAPSMIAGMVAEFLTLLAATGVVAFVEHRPLLDYNLTGPSRFPHFLSGLAAGFAALSILVGLMSMGGWLYFGPVQLTGSAVFHYAFLWSLGFLLVAFSEEGGFRCFLQFSLTRCLNFWWALAINLGFCLWLMIRSHGNGAWGVYLAAMAGLLPCLWMHREGIARRNFWFAAWVSSTAFGFIHTSNNGENWIGILAASAIGFVFCVSVYLTGSAWWAIGCHAAWDWAETFFYGTADSGMIANGHFFSTTATGNPFFSGGNDGPEGSLLVFPVILLLLVLVIALYRKTPTASTGNVESIA
jgi:hypothetical protein